MLSFILGGIYTLAVLAAGIFVGWSISKGVDAETLDEIQRMTPTKRASESGSVRPFTKLELEHMEDKAVRKMGEVLDALHKRD